VYKFNNQLRDQSLRCNCLINDHDIISVADDNNNDSKKR